MIVQNINSHTQVIYTLNPEADYKKIAESLNYTRKDGMLYKNVIKDSSTYYPNGSDRSLTAVKLISKEVTTYIVESEYTFQLTDSTFPDLINVFKRFGDTCIIKFNGIELSGPFSYRDGVIISNSGKTITSNTSTNNVTHTLISQFIHHMGTDNGNMLHPIIQRFVTTMFLFKGNKHLLTGYANLKQYLHIMKQPMPKFNSITQSEQSDYVINYDVTSLSKAKVIDVKDGTPVIEIVTNNKLTQFDSSTSIPEPYILITTKPIQMQNQTFPYTVVRYKGTSLFISPLIFNSRKILEQLPGGINLLK